MKNFLWKTKADFFQWKVDTSFSSCFSIMTCRLSPTTRILYGTVYGTRLKIFLLSLSLSSLLLMHTPSLPLRVEREERGEREGRRLFTRKHKEREREGLFSLCQRAFRQDFGFLYLIYDNNAYPVYEVPQKIFLMTCSFLWCTLM